MIEDLGLPSIAFIAVSMFAFAWMVRLSLNIHRNVHEHARHVHDRLDDLEDVARGLRKDVHSLSLELNDKADVTYIEKRLDGLMDVLKEQKK